MGFLPGAELEGPEAGLAEADIVADGVIQLETRPSDPYSVNIGFLEIAGAIHIDPASDRKCYGHIIDDPQVRIRLEGAQQIYPATAVIVENPEVLAQFCLDRTVLKLVPR